MKVLHWSAYRSNRALEPPAYVYSAAAADMAERRQLLGDRHVPVRQLVRRSVRLQSDGLAPTACNGPATGPCSSAHFLRRSPCPADSDRSRVTPTPGLHCPTRATRSIPSSWESGRDSKSIWGALLRSSPRTTTGCSANRLLPAAANYWPYLSCNGIEPNWPHARVAAHFLRAVGGPEIQAPPLDGDSAQKIHLRPNWIRRGSPAVMIVPAAGRPIDVFGRPNTGVLVKLKDSNRNCR